MITLSAFGDEISPDLDVQMDVLASEGIRHLDLRSVNGKNVLKFTDEEAADIKKRLNVRGFRVASIGSPIGKIMITDDFDTHLKEFRRAIQLAHFFGTPYIRVFSFYMPKGKSPYIYRAEVLKRMKKLAEIAEQEGVILVLENDVGLYGSSGERAKEILNYVHSPYLYAAFDPANFIRSQVNPIEAYQLVKPYVAYYHMKDARFNTGQVVPPGEGDADLPKLLVSIKADNYTGFMSIEPHLKAEGKYAELNDVERFKIVATALKKLLEEAGIQWDVSPNPSEPERDLPPSCPPTDTRPFPTWIPLASLNKMAQTPYDVLIVGSGAGGGAVLWRLCEQLRQSGKRIGMVEAGDLLLPTNARNLRIMSGGRMDRYFANPEIQRPIGMFLPEFSGAKQVIALGGRTLQWGGVCPRMPLQVLQKWPVPMKELAFYYNIAEQNMNITDANTRESLINQILLKRLWARGYDGAMGYPVAFNIKPTKYGEVPSDAYFSSVSFLAKALNLRPFDLAVNARAVQVFIDKGRAAGVQVITPEQQSHFIHAKHVVLSAGSLETPRLLLNSGIRGSAIGHYLTDAAAVRTVMGLNRKELPEIMGKLGIIIPETEERPYQLQLFPKEPTLPEQMTFYLHGYGKVEPQFENSVTLDSNKKDKYGVPEIQVHYSYSPKDLTNLQKMLEGIGRVFTAIDAFPIPENSEPTIYLRPPGDDNWESGTCRMGDDPLTSATDRYGQIHGIPGLFVADNSVLPSLGTNPTLTTVALAISTADYIVQQLK